MRRIFYGWWIVAVAFITHCLTTGIVFYSFGVFLPALTEAFGWTRAQASLGFSLASLCGAFYSPAVGRVVDRRGSRPSQLVGAVAMAVGFWLLHGITSLAQFYLVMGVVVSLGATALGGLPSNAAVTRWFVRRRGQALGIATAGISMGGVIFVPLTEWLIARHGWRGAFGWLGVIVLVAAVPPVALLMRRAPEAMGLHPDGDTHAVGADPAAAREIERSWTAAQALRSRNFWLITAAFSLTGAGLSATLLHQIAFLRDRGLRDRRRPGCSAPRRAWACSASSASARCSTASGSGRSSSSASACRPSASCCSWRRPPRRCSPSSSSSTASRWAATRPCGRRSSRACFGRLHYGAIAGWMTPFIVFIQALSIPLAGAVRDTSGTYEPAFAAIIGLTLVAMVCIAGLDSHAHAAPEPVATPLP